MTTKLISVFAAAAVAFGILLVSSAEAQTTWTVTVYATHSGLTPGYKVTGANSPTNSTVCSSPPAANTNTPCSTCNSTFTTQPYTGDLYVCPGDTIIWTAQTSNTSSNKNDLYIFDEDQILTNTTPANPKTPGYFHVFNGSSITGTAAGDGYGTHKYVVVVWDNDAGRLYVQDPQIVIGGGT